MDNRWVILSQGETNKINLLKEQLSIPTLIAKILVQRGINTYDKSKKYFRPQLTDLYDPFLMKDMKLAVTRIKKAIQNSENILIYGDYDVDGTTAVSLLYLFLKTTYNNVSYYIPDRYNEGYGVSLESIDFAEDNNFTLIISLDCGIRANDQIIYAKNKNIDFIICDHHLPGDKVPEAVAVLDPQQKDCNYPYKFLSGCGVGFKLIQALAPAFSIDNEVVYSFLDFVAVSIAADIVPLTDENKILAHYGIQILRTHPRIGLKVMIPTENNSPLTISNIVFQIAPKINAAGRINHASQAVELLISNDINKVNEYVKSINELNATRKELDSEITESAIKQVIETNQINNFSTVVYNPNWHKGVIGIVASRLTEVYYKPTLVFTQGKENEMVASARSVKDFDVYSAIENCAEYLIKFGGHKYAAGLTLDKKYFDDFKQKFEDEVKKNISTLQTIPSIEINQEIEFEELSTKIYRLINQMEPFGPENMQPIFLTKNVKLIGKYKLMGKNDEHLRLSVTKNNINFDVTAFGMGNLLNKFTTCSFDLVYQLDENHWQGKIFYRIMAKDVKFYNNE